MTKPKLKPKPPGLDKDKARACFVIIEPHARGLARDNLAKGKLNLVAAAIAAVGVSKRCMEVTLHDRFKSLPKTEFDMDHVDNLSNLAWGTWHAADEAESLKAHATDAKLEARMQRCCEYYFSDHPVIGKELDRLRPGTDYADLASDLVGYARIYEAQHAIISKDLKHYRPTDREEALRMSAKIIDLLGEGLTAEAKRASDMAIRCFTLLLGSYNEVSAAGLWLLRHDPDAERFFPSLYAIARRPAGHADAESEPEADEQVDPAVV